MKKFKLAFIVGCICFSVFYIYAIAKGAKNPYENLFSKAKPDNEIEVDNENNENKDEKDTEKPEVKDEKPKEISGELFMVVMGVTTDDVKSKSGQKQLTDTMILTKLNFDTGEIVMMNLPRDTMVNLPNRGRQKLNAAHVFGGNEGSIDAIRKLSDLDLNRYVTIDYQAVKKLVDAIGGVDFDVPVDMWYKDPTANPPLNINLKKGPQKLDGDKALQLLRWRKNQDYTTGGYGDGSDVARIETQQAFIAATIKQAVSFKNLFRLPAILKEVLPNVDTNLDVDQMLSAAASAGKLNPEKITSLKLPGAGQYVDNISFWVQDKEESQKLFKEYFGNYYLGN